MLLLIPLRRDGRAVYFITPHDALYHNIECKIINNCNSNTVYSWPWSHNNIYTHSKRNMPFPFPLYGVYVIWFDGDYIIRDIDHLTWLTWQKRRIPQHIQLNCSNSPAITHRTLRYLNKIACIYTTGLTNII